MDESLRYILPIYLCLYLAIVLFYRAFITWKKTNIFPIVLDKKDDTRGIVTKCLLATYALLIINILIFSFSPKYYTYLGTIDYLNNYSIQILGMVILVTSLIWIAIAQSQMSSSWRMGIDDNSQTELIKNGLYKYSRNPIYVGMIASIFGIFLVLPSAISLLNLGLAFTLFQVQIRLEEEFLFKMHNQELSSYMKSTRRWI